MEITVSFKASKNENTLQVIDCTIPDSYFSILELKEEAYNPNKSGRYSNRCDFTFEGIGYALVFKSKELNLGTTANKFCIEAFRNSLESSFTISITPETKFYQIDTTNGIHAFIAALQIMFHSTTKDDLRSVFRSSWDGSILSSVYDYIINSFVDHSTNTKYSTTKNNKNPTSKK